LVRNSIRPKVHDFHLSNQQSRLNYPHSAHNDPDIRDIRRTTLQLLHKVQFAYERKRNEVCMTERENTVSWRHTYIVRIKKFMGKNLNIVYKD
jgi:hypothetical protein